MLVQGYTEVRYDEERKRVVYEPLQLTQAFRFVQYISREPSTEMHDNYDLYYLPQKDVAERQGTYFFCSSAGLGGGTGLSSFGR